MISVQEKGKNQAPDLISSSLQERVNRINVKYYIATSGRYKQRDN
jgi:hypothetical protein